jgi:predicted nucleic acid-binding protein
MWIALIKRERGRFDACKYVVEKAQRGEVEIWTSTFTLAEVWKRKCGGDDVGILETDDEAFEDYIEQDFVVRVAVDTDVGTAARRLLRKHPTIAKPQDAIHVATALIENIDELHTFDRADLLSLDGALERQDGNKLKICVPPPPPDPDDGTLFEGLKNHDEHEAQKRATD